MGRSTCRLSVKISLLCQLSVKIFDISPFSVNLGWWLTKQVNSSYWSFNSHSLNSYAVRKKTSSFIVNSSFDCNGTSINSGLFKLYDHLFQLCFRKIKTPIFLYLICFLPWCSHLHLVSSEVAKETNERTKVSATCVAHDVSRGTWCKTERFKNSFLVRSCIDNEF